MKKNDMPHTPYDAAPTETPRASEPVATYGHAAATESPPYHPTAYEKEVIMQSKKDFEEGRFYAQEEVDKMVEEWLRPMTMADIHRRIDEAEAEIEAGEVITCEDANAEIRRLLPWLL